MDTLSSPRVADVLTALFDDAVTADQSMAQKSDDVLIDDDMMSWAIAEERRDYKAFYQSYPGNYWCIAPEFGRLLYVLARACGARRIVEFGTSFGVSTIHLASALRDAGGGGKVITTEIVPEKSARARQNLAAAGLDDLVEFRVGDALETLQDGFDGPVDLLLLDGAFSLYHPVLRLVEPYLRPGSLVLGENALETAGPFLDYVRDPANGYAGLTLPFEPSRGNHLAVRTG
ncbi:methyltransferase [Actinosynnema sp. ALI-1.44]|uniref:O-methyltransferase n=1 Tax=Actinosynnema sp. ALI-1.44 TaxID=1933779 RepID=UPI00097BD269|nr:class I SAM-dependent methyltransferase [Actinosynnema sp. ALI-1.44]ONI78051.1 methyltransferase [Actinosynnema sp. ALI-1.44]